MASWKAPSTAHYKWNLERCHRWYFLRVHFIPWWSFRQTELSFDFTSLLAFSTIVENSLNYEMFIDTCSTLAYSKKDWVNSKCLSRTSGCSRLAISNAAQGQGIGKLLLADAIKRTLAVSDQIAIYTMVVDAINDNARGFYEQFGFARLSDDSPRLFLPLKSIMI